MTLDSLPLADGASCQEEEGGRGDSCLSRNPDVHPGNNCGSVAGDVKSAAGTVEPLVRNDREVPGSKVPPLREISSAIGLQVGKLVTKGRIELASRERGVLSEEVGAAPEEDGPARAQGQILCAVDGRGVGELLGGVGEGDGGGVVGIEGNPLQARGMENTEAVTGRGQCEVGGSIDSMGKIGQNTERTVHVAANNFVKGIT